MGCGASHAQPVVNPAKPTLPNASKAGSVSQKAKVQKNVVAKKTEKEKESGKAQIDQRTAKKLSAKVPLKPSKEQKASKTRRKGEGEETINTNRTQEATKRALKDAQSTPSAVARILQPAVWEQLESESAVAACLVRCVDGEEKMSMAFSLNGIDRRLERNQDEPLSNALARLAKTLQKKSKKEEQGQPRPEENNGDPWLEFPRGAAVPGNTPNRDAWDTGHALHVGGAVLECRRNRPTVTSLALKPPFLPGFSVQPSFVSEFAEGVALRWSTRTDDAGPWETVAEEASYLPSAADSGSLLRLEALPWSTDAAGEVVLGTRVVVEGGARIAGPVDLSPYEERWRYVEETRPAMGAGERLRVLSYNLLAGGTPAERSGHLEFCAAEALDINYRKQLFTREILGYEADVACLQEVTPRVYGSYMAPAMAAAGWEGAYCAKNFGAQMACAVFVRAARWRIREQLRIDLWREWAEEAAGADGAALRDAVPGGVRAALDAANTVALVLVLEERRSAGAAPVVVVDTHLMGRPTDQLARVLQVAAILRRVEAVREASAAGAGVVLCGDLNSTPEEAVHELLQEGRLSKDHPVWAAAGPEGGREGGQCAGAATGVDLQVPMRFTSAAAHVPCTYVGPGGEGAVIDYIYVSAPHFAVPATRFPDLDPAALRRDSSIPAARFPSDHVAVVQDVLRRAPDAEPVDEKRGPHPRRREL